MRRLYAPVLLLLLLISGPALGQAPEPTPQGQLILPDAARPGPAFDVELATRAYLDTLPADARARSDAYYEGG